MIWTVKSHQIKNLDSKLLCEAAQSKEVLCLLTRLMCMYMQTLSHRVWLQVYRYTDALPASFYESEYKALFLPHTM